MFEHYMKYQGADPIRRRRLQMAAVISGVTTASLITFMWVANKMSIVRVDAPTVSYIMVQMAADEPPPPPPPPPPPSAADEVEQEVIPDEEVPLEEDIVQPRETPESVPEQKGRKVPTGVRGGVPGGIPGGVVGGVLGGSFGGGGVATKRDTSKNVAKQPIKSVMAQAIYSPDPDKKKLAGTKAGMFDKRPGINKTAFCVDKTGKTVAVRTVRKFPGDPMVDKICRDTVKKWRFKPFLAGGKPVKTCSTVEFNIKFQ
jgi:protein TonB